MAQGASSTGLFGKLGIGGNIGGSPFLGAVARGAATSVVTQGLAVATGLQNRFDWAGVAAAGVGAGVTSALGVNPVSGGNRSVGAYLSNVGASMASDIANAATRSLVQGSDFGDNIIAALPDTIAQTIGNVIANGVAQSPSDEIPSDTSDAEQAQELGVPYDPNGAQGGPVGSNVGDQAAFEDIGLSEVSGLAKIADRVSPPTPRGGGWTIGWEQEDFSTNATVAQVTLIQALIASGYVDAANSQKAAAAFTAAGASSSVNFAGVVDTDGDPVDLGTINDALATPAASSSIYRSSYNNYTTKFDALMKNISEDDNVLQSVHSAMADPTYGPMLQLVIADYNNQIGMNPNSAGGMMGLLTTGSGRSNGGVITKIDETNPKSVTESVMQYYLNSQYVANGNGSDVGRRLAYDVQSTFNAEMNSNVQPPVLPILVSSSSGTLSISRSAGGAFKGVWMPYHKH